MKYKDFDAWIDDIENYGTRYERFLNEWDTGMDPTRMVEWLKAAWECARMENDNGS